MSLKSSRFRHGLLPPEFQMQPRCTGSAGVASTVVQVLPPLYVNATYKCQTPRKSADCVSPTVGVPRNAKAARLSSPAMTSANSAFWTANAVRVHAPHVWNVSRTVRRDADVPVQTAAGSGGKRTVNAVDGCK